jgi:hypothetical protein
MFVLWGFFFYDMVYVHVTRFDDLASIARVNKYGGCVIAHTTFIVWINCFNLGRHRLSGIFKFIKAPVGSLIISSLI